MILVIALAKGWKVRQWDVVAAYLQAKLRHDIYVVDIHENGETEYWKLHKALYGSKQAGHEWFQMLKNILEESSLQQCIGDEGCYVGTASEILLGTHVDDLLGIAPSEQILDEIEEKIERYVELEKRGKPKKMLGVEIEWMEYGIVLTQRNLIETIIEGHGIAGAKPSLPIDRSWFEARDNMDKPCNQK
jgi:hypothetical protein